MPRWRREVVHDVEVEARAGRLRWTRDDVASTILDFSPVPPRWSVQRDDDGDDNSDYYHDDDTDGTKDEDERSSGNDDNTDDDNTDDR
mgnify:CR=1 FL=1